MPIKRLLPFTMDLLNLLNDNLTFLIKFRILCQMRPFHKSKIKVSDLAAFTAKTGDEFALFTRGSHLNSSLILNSSGRRNVFDINNNWRVHS